MASFLYDRLFNAFMAKEAYKDSPVRFVLFAIGYLEHLGRGDDGDNLLAGAHAIFGAYAELARGGEEGHDFVFEKMLHLLEYLGGVTGDARFLKSGNKPQSACWPRGGFGPRVTLGHMHRGGAHPF